MNRKEILLICLILCFICSVSAVSAADADNTTDTVLATSTTDVVSISNDLSSYSHSENNQILRGENDGAGSFSDLQSNITAAGNYLKLTNNYTYNSSSDSALSSTGIVINKDFTLEGEEGKNITINALSMSKLFKLDGSITLKNINFISGTSPNDAPINSVGSLTVENCMFANGNGFNGGAIHAMGGLNVSTSTFYKNMARNGGSIFIEDSSSTSSISGCTFSEDQAFADGGSINSASSLLTLYNLSFDKCDANNYGGAIMLSGHNTTLDNINITNCMAMKNGGAVYFRHNHKLLSNLRFEGNEAMYGGAIYCYPECEGTDDGGLVNVTFKGNIAIRNGGAMHVSGDNGRMINVTFESNEATYDGGAIVINGTGWRVYNSTFKINTAAIGHGGAMYIENGTGITIDNCNFTSNVAGGGGGAINSYEDTNNALINNSRFISNTANGGDGGAVYWKGNNSNIEKSYFKDNNAITGRADTGYGGAISLSGSYDTIYNCTFKQNTAGLDGGSIIIQNAAGTTLSMNNTVKDSTFEYNNASRNGGAICWNINCRNGTIINSTFNNNSAGATAGAVLMQSDRGSIYNSTFDGNRALGSFPGSTLGNGGAIAFTGNHNYAYNTTFRFNTADNHGGAAYVKSTDIKNSNDTTFVLCHFTNNTAEKNGGAVDWSAGSINGNIFNSTFENNTAKRSGGAVYWSGTYGEVLYSTFTNNLAVGSVNDGDGGGDGGAILWIGSHGQVDHCNFTYNLAKYRGGAVYLKGESKTVHSNDTNFTYCRFINNTAELNGGAIDWQAGANNGRLEHGVFINNTALRSAGAVFWYGTNGTMEDCNFTNNRATGEVTEDDRKYLGNIYLTVGGNGGAVVWSGSVGRANYVNFENNYAHNLGGAIYLEQNDNVTISHANFTNNWADINGGAIDWSKGAANGRVEYANFINNTAKRSGGAIYWYGHNGTLYNVSFKNNRALGNASYVNPFGETTMGGDGGAVFWTGYDGNVTRSEFINNSAVKRGGAVFLQGTSDLECNNTRFTIALFENNTAGTNGGAVDWFSGATNGAILNATFNNNIANRSGGAIYWNGDYGSIMHSNFTNNTAKGETWAYNAYGEYTQGGSGGAVIWSGSHGLVYDSRFINNTAARHGGAVYMQGTSTENCTNTTFDLCHFEGNNATINGGALDWHEGAHNGLINNSFFTNNRARANGGAIFWSGHDGDIINSNFTYNYALGIVSDDNGNQGDGGAIIWSGINGDVDNCWFKFNNASARGGAVYIQSCAHGNKNTTFDHSHFINNTAAVNGGAVDWHEGAEHGLVNNTEFINNTAGVNGGAIFWNGHDGDIVNSNFTNNFAVQNGGAVFWLGDIGIINGSRFEYNYVSGDWNRSTPTLYYLNPDTGINEAHYNITGGDGGAIMWKGSHGTIEDTTFYKNYSPYRGGAIFFTGTEYENCTNITIKKGNFTLNHAGLNGGAVDWAKGAYNATILNSYFNNNTADRSGGAIYVSGNELDIEHSEFNYNEVTGLTKYDNRTGVLNYTSIGANGGAICWMGSYGDIIDVTFLNNTANQRGGAIQFEKNQNTTIKDSRFINNTAGTEGGAIDFYHGAENADIITSNFTGNIAQENGGAIFWQGHYGSINGSRFEDNKALGLGDRSVVSGPEDNPKIDGTQSEIRYNVTGGDGGAIKWTGSHGIIESTTFYRNDAAYNGGALYFIGNSTENSTNITFIDCNFTQNLAKLNGGAVFWASGASNATVSDSHFINNTAWRSAGAIYINGNYLEIDDTDFRYNDATCAQTYDNRTGSSFFSSLGGNAGAICWMGSYGTVDNGTFINNTAAERGGAIQFETNKNGTVKNSWFENNSAYGDGGAIDWYQGAENGRLINSTFLTNYITGPNGRGSGVYIEGYNATIKDSRFKKHNTNADGGVIYIEGNKATVDNSTFDNINSNKRGGAIYIHGNNTIVKESNFTDVHADNKGGVMYIDGQNTTVTDCRFNDTFSLDDGGAIYVTGLYCHLSNSTFKNNTAGDDGGAIYWNGNYGIVYNITCQDTQAISMGTHHSKGGAICLTSNYTSVNKSSFTDSFSSYNGGAMFITGNHVNITETEFKTCRVNNTLTPDGDNLPYGGAAYVLGNYTNLYDCTFDNCTAIQGGVVYIYGHNATVNNASCNGSYATQYGGSFYIDGENATISNSDIQNSTAYSSGGAIYIYGPNAKVSNTTLKNTLAGQYGIWKTDGNGNIIEVTPFGLGDGGAIYIEGNNTVIYNATITSTNATQRGGAIFVDGNNASIYVSVRDSSAGSIKIDLTSNADIIIANIDDMSSFLSQIVQVSKNNLSSFKTTLTNIKNDVSKIFVNNAFNQANFDSINNRIAQVRTTLDSFITISPVFNCLLSYLDYIDADLNNISTNKNSTEFDNVLKKNITKNLDSMINFVDDILKLGTSLNGAKDIANKLFDKPDYDSVNAELNKFKNKFDTVTGYVNNLIGYNSTFAQLSTNVSNINVQYNKILSVVQACHNKGIPGHGGAIYVKGNDTLIHDSSFINSYGLNGGNGGAINIAGNNAGANARIINSNFTTCAVVTDDTKGGAISVEGVNATIKGANFNDCSAVEKGGAIYIKGINTNILESNFTESKTSSATSDGGAIYVDGNNATIRASNFVGSKSEDQGGAIYIIGGFAKVLESNFNSSKSNYGAGIYIQGNNATVNASTFTKNNAPMAGGAIYSNGVGSKVYNSNFTENNGKLGEQMDTGGGAIYWVGGAKGDTIENCTFIRNDAGFGGAIRWVNKAGVAASGLIKNCTFDANHGYKGSVISWASSNSALITGCTFKNNNAYKNGCIYAGSNGMGANGVGFNISDCEFINNSADFCGGDIALAMAYAVIKNCNFTGSQAGYGGSIVLRESSPIGTQIINCTFINTTSRYLAGHNDNKKHGGGAIYLEQNHPDIKVINVTIINSTSTTDGGAIKWVGDRGTLENVLIINSTAQGKYLSNPGYGGGIYWTGENGNFTNVTVINAKSKTNGGGVYVGGDSLNISKSNFINCTAIQGGGIYWANTNGIVSDSNFTNNSARDGGAIYWAGTSGKVLNSLFTGNNATNGGAVYWIGENGRLEGVTFIENHADYGGAAYWKVASSKFTNNELYHNTADYGGAVYWDVAGGSIDNSIMMYNRAINGSAIYIKQTIGDVINTTLLENQALSYEIYNKETTVIQRTQNTITVHTFFRGGDNLLNAIYNAASDIYFTNVTYLGVNGTRNTKDKGSRICAVVLAADEYPSDPNEIYQTNLEVYQDIFTYTYDGNNKLVMNVTKKTDYMGRVSFDYTDPAFASQDVNVKVFHPEDNYYTYIAFSNATKLPVIFIEAENIYFQGTEYLNITVRPLNISENDPVTPGNLTIHLHGKDYKEYFAFENITLNTQGTSGWAMVPISGLYVDTYSVYVEYCGNQYYVPEYNGTSFKVQMINSTISVYVPNYYYGDSQKVIIQTIRNASNTVSVILNGQQYWVDVDDTGYAELDIPVLNAGNYTVEAFYPESRNCYASSNSTAFEVYKVNSTINITGKYVDNFNSVVLHVEVGPGDAIGFVNITFNGKEYELSITNSTADLTIMNVPRGQYTVNATYGGDINHWGSNNTTVINATKFTTPIIIDVTNITYGENETIIFTLPPNTAGNNLTITFNGQTFNKTIDNNGQVILENMTLAAGDYPVIAYYAGDNNYAASSNQTIFNVAKAIPVMDPVVQNITYSQIENIIVNINQTGNVSIIIRDLLTGEIITQNLTINITNGRNVTWDIPNLPRGEYITEFIFSGNQNYTGCAMNRTFVVDYATPLIIVEVDNIDFGDNATVNVTVYPTDKVTGNVTIYVDGINMGVFNLTDGFTQLFNVSGLLSGVHDAVAVYNGDNNYTHRDNSTTFTVVLVSKVTPPFSVEGMNLTVFDDEIISVNLPANATGMVYLKVNGTPYYLNLTAGERQINIGKLRNGTYTVEAEYTGDYYWNGISNTTQFNITKVDSIIQVTAENIIYGDKAVLNITTSQGICGNVTVNVNGTDYTAYVSGGHGLLVLDNLGVGNYPVEVTFDGCAKYKGNFNTTSFTVSKVNATSDIRIIDQGNGTVVVVLPGNATGDVNITVGDKVFNATVINGTAVVTLENVTPGVNNITVFYSGDGNYTNITVNATVTIPRFDSPIDASVHNIYVGDIEEITVTLPVNATGTVTIEINGVTYTNSTIVGGIATFRVPNLAYGSKTVAVRYSGDANYSSNFTTRSFTVNKRSSFVNVTVTATVVGADTIINVTIPANATGYVLIKLDGQNYTINTTNGNGSIVIKGLGNTTHILNATYLGDEQYFASYNNTNFTLSKVPSFVRVSVDNITYGDKVVIRITVPQDATGNVTTVIVGKNTYYVPVSNGTGILVVPELDVDEYTVQVTYNGDGKYLTENNSTSFRVAKVNATGDIKVVDLGNGTVVVVLPGNATGDVNITVGDKVFNATVINGTAVVTLENVTPGVNNITVFYSGDGNYTNITVNATVNIPKLAAEIHAHVDDVYVGDTAYVVVTLPQNATGSVTIEVDGKPYATTNIVSGTATIPVPNMAYGNKTVAVVYSGNANYTENFTSTNFTVNKRSSFVNVTVAATVVGADTIINVTIPANATGYVLIKLDGQNYTINTTNGNGSIVIKGLGNTTHILNVTYLGDEQYFASYNNTNFTLSKVPSFVRVSVDNITYGDKAVIRITVPQDATGDVLTVVVGKDTYYVPVSNGTGMLVVSGLEVGDHTVYVTYNGDGKYLASLRNETVFNVAKVNATGDIRVIDQGNGTVVVVLPGNATGDVNITVGDKVFNATVINGTAVVTLENVTPGVNNITVFYSGDGNYTNITVNDTVTIPRFDSPIDAFVHSIYVGDVEEITVTLPVNATGTVTIEINGVTYTNSTIVGGIATFRVSNLAYGSKTVAVRYSGDANYTGNFTTRNFTVNKRNSFVNVSANATVVGMDAIVNVTIPANATGYVIVNINGTNFTINTTNGNGSVVIKNLGNGFYNVTVTYLGDDQYLSSVNNTNFTIDRIEPTFIVNGTDITYGAKELIKFETEANITGLVKVEIGNRNYTAFIYEGKGNLTVENLAADKYNVTLYFEGNYKYTNATAKNNFTIRKATIPVIVIPHNITYGEKEFIDIYVNATGKVNITIVGDVMYMNRDIGRFEVLGYLDADNYTVIVDYGGNENYTSNSGRANFTVYKKDPVITVEVQNITYGNVEHIIVHVNAPGNVTIKVNGTKETINLTDTGSPVHILRISQPSVPDYNKLAKEDLYNLNVGEYPVEVTYNGNTNYNAATVRALFFVNKANTTVNVDVTDIMVDGKELINVTVNNTNATGFVVINVDGVNHTRPLVNGTANLTLDKLSNGTHSVVVIYRGDDNFRGNWTSATFNVTKIKPQITVHVDNTEVGQTATIKVDIPENATGFVVIDVDGTKYHVDITKGQQYVTLDMDKLENKTYMVTAEYSGDDYYDTTNDDASFNVSKVKSNITVKVENITLGDVAAVNVTVITGATGNVTITIGNEFNETVGVTDGAISVIVPGLTVGDKTVNVTYNGNEKYLPSSNSTDFHVDKINSTSNIKIVDNGNGTVTVIVPQNATGNVTIYVDGKNFTANVTDGMAVIPLENVTPGKHNITAVYSGDDTYTNSTVPAVIDIPKYDTPIEVVVPEAKEGETTYITVNVPENATGNVTVTIDGRTFTAEIIDGTVTIPVENLTAGDKSVVVEYPGDDNYINNYAVANFTVEKAKVVPDVKVVDLGNGTVVVLVCGNASGNATIKVGNDNVTAPVVNGTAIFTLDNLTSGNNDIEVIYSGDDVRTNKTIETTITGPKYDTPFEVVVPEVKEGVPTNVTVKVPGNATGNVTITIDGKQFTGEIINGAAIIPVGNLTAGDKSVVVEYPGDDNYINNYTVANFTVEKVKAVPEMYVVDQGNGTVVVIVPDNATGNVTVKVGNENVTVPVVNGTAVVTLDNLTPGDNSVEVIYSGDNAHTNATVYTNVTGPKYDTPIEVVVPEAKEGETTYITVNVPENATGNVTVTIDGRTFTAEIIDGTVTIPVENLTAGDKSVVVEYPGDDNYINNYTIHNFSVEKAKVTPDIKVFDYTNGTVVVVVGDNATGNVTIKVGNDTYVGEVINGTAVINLDNVTPGAQDMEIIYSGDDAHTNATISSTVIGPKDESSFNITTEVTQVGDNAIITVNLPKNATGNVTIEVDGVKYVTEVINGTAKFEIANLTDGTKTVAVEYSGDDNYLANHTTATITISKRPSYVYAEIIDIDVGENVIITVHVPDDATGQVLIDIDGVGYYVNVTNGMGIAEIPRMPNGVYDVNLTYVGDDKYLPSYNESSFNVNKVPSFVIPVAKDIYVGEYEPVTLTVPEDATGIVTLVIDGKEYNFNLDDGTLSKPDENEKYTVAVSQGSGKLIIVGLQKGDYIVSVKYNGDAKYLPSTNTTAFRVIKSDTKMDVIDQGNGTVVVQIGGNASGTVEIKLGNETYNATVENGVAIVDLTNATPGRHEIEVIYSGDGSHDGKKITSEVVIPKHDCPISVSAHDIYVDDTETVVVTLPEDATGNVTIEINGKKYSTDKIVNGKATFDVKGLAVGDKTVAVMYSGDEKYRDNFTTGQFSVKKRPSNTKATAMDIVVGKDASITVTVPKDATGRVLIEIDGVGYYADIINGKAKIIVPDLSAGKYGVKVTYDGDDRYLASAAATSFKVSKVKTPVEASGDDIYIGDDGTVIVNLPSDATGSVTITVDGKKYTTPVKDGKAVFKVPGLRKGNHKVSVYYSGDSKYAANETVTDINVRGDDTPHHYGENNGGINLTLHKTGNPLLVILLVLITVGLTQIRRFRK